MLVWVVVYITAQRIKLKNIKYYVIVHKNLQSFNFKTVIDNIINITSSELIKVKSLVLQNNLLHQDWKLDTEFHFLFPNNVGQLQIEIPKDSQVLQSQIHKLVLHYDTMQ